MKSKAGAYAYCAGFIFIFGMVCMNINGKYPITNNDMIIGELLVEPRGSMHRFRARCSAGLDGVFRLAVLSGGMLAPIGIMAPSGGGWSLEKTLSPAALRSMGITSIDGATLTGAEAGMGAVAAAASCAPAPQIDKQHLSEAAGWHEGKAAEAAEPAEEEAMEQAMEPAEEEAAAALPDNSPESRQLYKDEAGRPDFAPPEVIHEIPAAYLPYGSPEPGGYEEGWAEERGSERLFKDPEIKRICRDMTDTLIKTEDGAFYLAVPIIRGRPFPAMPIFCFGTSRKINGKNYVVFKIKDGELIL